MIGSNPLIWFGGPGPARTQTRSFQGLPCAHVGQVDLRELKGRRKVDRARCVRRRNHQFGVRGEPQEVPVQHLCQTTKVPSFSLAMGRRHPFPTRGRPGALFIVVLLA
jgi:hypothetical protein